MRLISADALKDRLKKLVRDGVNINYDIDGTIDSAPTIKPKREPGRWVSVGCVVPSIANVPMIKCTVCGHLEPDVDAARTPYCSHCGAFMGVTGGGQDGSN